MSNTLFAVYGKNRIIQHAIKYYCFNKANESTIHYEALSPPTINENQLKP